MSWLEMDQVLLSLSIALSGNAIYCLAAWLLPPVVTIAVVALGGLFVVAWVLTK